VRRETQLEELQRRKEQLVSQSEANRRRLAADWKILQSPRHWRDEALELARRHPMWVAALAATAGTLTFSGFRQRRTLIGRLGRWTKVASVALSVWKIFRGKKAKP
jgi:type VI protein secretion system component VasF